jgi:succinate-acetate transporter protein
VLIVEAVHSISMNDNTGFLNQKDNIVKVGGYFGIATALIAYYCGLADMLGPNDLFTLPTGKHEARRLD